MIADSHTSDPGSTLDDRAVSDPFHLPRVAVSARSHPRGHSAAEPTATSTALREHVARAVRRYLADLNGHDDGELHAFVLREVETPLFTEVMHHCDGNLTRAAATLGLNRATLRKRLRDLGLLEG